MAEEGTGNCVKVTYIPNSVCFYSGYPVTYVAGQQQITLTGKIPRDKRWDGKKMILYGHLVENNQCTMFFVDKATPCGEPTVDN